MKSVDGLHSMSSLKTEEATEEIEVLTVKEAASLLRVSVTTMYRLSRKEEIPRKLIGGQLRFLKSDLVDWLKGDAL